MAVIPIYIPTYISDQTYKPARVLPRLLFYNGQVECEPYWVQNQLAQQFEQSTFPYFDNYNVVSGSFPTVNSKSLLFYNEEASYGQTPTASLYSEYWSTYLNLLYNPLTKLINASAIIPLADYRELKQNDVVEFRSNYYHLRAINDYNLKNGECTIQLLGPILADSLNLPTKLFFKCFGYDVSDCDVACTDADLCNPTTTTSTTSTSTTSTTTTTTIAPLILTPPVQAFVTASGITGSAINYVQILYNDLSGSNLFDKMYAIYPFVGANANSHRYNLVNTGSYTITFNGSWVHDSNGITGNGTNTSANTGIIPNTFNAQVPEAYAGDMWYVSSSLHIYSRTNGPSGIDIGSRSTGNNASSLIIQYNVTGSENTVYSNTQNSAVYPTQLTASGFFGGSTLATTIYNNQGNIVSGSASGSNGVYKNGVKLVGFEQTPYVGNAVSNVPLFIGALNDGTGPLDFTNRNYAFAAIGKGLTQNEMATLYTIVQNFETSLNRQV